MEPVKTSLYSKNNENNYSMKFEQQLSVHLDNFFRS